MKEYPEIEALKSYFEQFKIEITKGDNPIQDDFFLIKLDIDDDSWEIYIDDEYHEFSKNSPLMCLFLVFSSLEMYIESEDYLVWNKQNNLNASDMDWLNYYKSLDTIYKEIENKVGKIDPCVSSYDYNFRTGVIDSLLNNDFPKGH
ncbi:MAG: hypothetical protein ACI8P3_004108 [Saprospiraceae bacterium]|jgi:hypothetical protein